MSIIINFLTRCVFLGLTLDFCLNSSFDYIKRTCNDSGENWCWHTEQNLLVRRGLCTDDVLVMLHHDVSGGEQTGVEWDVSVEGGPGSVVECSDTVGPQDFSEGGPTSLRQYHRTLRGATYGKTRNVKYGFHVGWGCYNATWYTW